MQTSTALRARRMRVRLAAVLALAMLGPPAFAGEPLHLEAVDDATGEALTDIQASVVDPARRVPRGRVESGVFDGVREAGDLLYVYGRGYHLGVIPLETATRVVVRLRAAPGRARVVLRDAGAAAGAWKASVLYRPLGRWRVNPFSDEITVHPEGDRFEVTVPEGMRTMVFPQLSGKEGVPWPVGLAARVDGVHEVHVDRGRDLVLRWGEDVAFRAGLVECMPDTLWDPAVDPVRIDAWRWRLNGPAWLREGLVGRGPTLRVCPDVPFHFFAVVRGVPFYRYVAKDDATLDLRARPLRSVRARPVIGGHALAEGGILAPGRLHLDALSTLRDVGDLIQGAHFVAGSEHEAWPDVRLPAAPWLTAWDPARGVAHLRWEEGVAATGSYGPGAIEVVASPGYEVTGKIAVFPVWKGTGSVRTTPPLGSLARPVPDDGHLRFPGLPLGTYGVSIAVDLRRRRTGEAAEAGRWAEVTLTRERPTCTVRLPTR